MSEEPNQPHTDEGSPSRPDESQSGQDLTVSFSGPLPPPGLLQQYKEIQPDFPERLLALTEQEAEHRRKVTHQAMRIDGTEVILGQIFGLIVALAAMVMVGYLGYLGHPVASVFFGFGTLSSLVAVFVWGRRKNETKPETPDSETN